jgi:hypothetical protein
MIWLVLSAAILGGQPAPELRLHHVHVTVTDPAAAMNEIAERLGGQRLILQGHGPAVRAGDQYVVFDRPEYLLDPPRPTISTSRANEVADAASLEAALRWMDGNGLNAGRLDAGAGRLMREAAHQRISTVAFSSSALQSTIDGLRARGLDPFHQAEDTARYRVSPELVVEIVGETDRPDTHWCPMHPAVRAAGPSRCPLCSMEMVPIPPPRVGEYALDVAASASTRKPQKTGEKDRAISLRLTVRDPRDGTVVTDFLQVHERPFHLFIVSRDLATFVHAHPEQRENGVFVLEQALAPGEYMVVGDFLPAGGTPQVVHRAVVTPGYTGALFQDPPRLTATPAEQIIDGLRVTLLAGAVTALRPAALRFVIADAATGAEVRDLEAYLGAAGHLLVVNADLTSAVHGHPAGAQTAGPEILFDPVLPKAGMYKLWLQVQRKGRIVTVPFVIEVVPL